MNRDELLYLAPYLFSLVLSVGIFLYAWQHRYIRGARAFTWLIGGQILTILSFILELATPGLQTKILWDTLQWLTTTFLVILPFLVFVVKFSEHKLRSPSLIWGLILTTLGLFATFLLTDNIHHLFYQNPRLAIDGPFSKLAYDFTWIIYLCLLFLVYLPTLYGITLLINRTLQPRSSFRWQYLIVACGFLIPLISSFFPLANIQLAAQLEITPIASAIGIFIAAWGLFRYGLFDIVPMAREHAFENMADPVVVLDPRNRITDINKAALTLLGKQRSEIIGRTPNALFAKWPAFIEVLNNPLIQKKEISVPNEGKTLLFDINISQLLGQSRELIGRIITIRDLTKLKTLEANYRTLSEELEQRVKTRTEELYTVAERYRTIVENQPDLIVRWKPDGTRTFVNEAYCRYWDISPDQALAMNFLFHAAEEDRPAIEEKISRLNAGTADIETEIHRVIRPDGTIAWQEWTDQAIRDEWGNLIEIQSIGRDITERKRAEEELNT